MACQAVLLVVFRGARWALHPGQAEPSVADQKQSEVPAPAPDPSTLMPHATEASPGSAKIEEMAKPWSSKRFSFAMHSVKTFLPC